MMENKSRKTAQINLQEVKLDIIKRGWFVCEAPEEAPYDLVVDLGLDEKNERIWHTVQVKTDLRTTSRPSGGKNEPVSILPLAEYLWHSLRTRLQSGKCLLMSSTITFLS